jgi:hypothetical protein
MLGTVAGNKDQTQQFQGAITAIEQRPFSDGGFGSPWRKLTQTIQSGIVIIEADYIHFSADLIRV